MHIHPRATVALLYPRFLCAWFSDNETKKERVISPGWLFGLGRKSEIQNVPVQKYYFPMVLRFSKEQPYIMEVYGRDQLTNAHKLAKLINEKLGYAITVRLQRT